MDKKIYIIAIVTVFVCFAAVFDTLPRSTYSELEKRELKAFPAFSPEKLADGSFTAEVSSWFSDSEPYRDAFMTLSMTVKDAIAITLPGEAVRFHASDTPMEAAGAPATPTNIGHDAPEGLAIDEYDNDITANENAKIANAGIIVVGEGDKVRALMAFGGNPKGGGAYAKLANACRTRKKFPSRFLSGRELRFPVFLFFCPVLSDVLRFFAIIKTITIY